MFDTLKTFNELTGAGFTEAQAKAQVEVLRVALDKDTIATKSDLKSLEQAMTIKLGAAAVLIIGVLTTIQKLL